VKDRVLFMICLPVFVATQWIGKDHGSGIQDRQFSSPSPTCHIPEDEKTSIIESQHFGKCCRWS
jgi:hypothetical protein